MTRASESSELVPGWQLSVVLMDGLELCEYRKFQRAKSSPPTDPADDDEDEDDPIEFSVN